jgi:hypothetical protein
MIVVNGRGRAGQFIAVRIQLAQGRFWCLKR